ncbi:MULTISPECIES: hypothetical protein [unclassified Bradyrhizobium]|uniref:hypothetical protein n=1 Tax=unclassified Bradyrhizobium TaxID=2631580 RepID=UPI001FFA6EE3|nr:MULTISPECIES: hypothetical protein [unclassified Bradyrhizobium]MCK1533151.1 hypothetical protein [Bradyrhizobium sp. 176]MCK1558277.1 hypothetical protein [Bradyrhizobium sp. 171]
MTDLFAHQIAARAAGAKVSVVAYRDPADGAETFGAAYTATKDAAERWLSPQRFTDRAHADAAAAVLAAFLGVRVEVR